MSPAPPPPLPPFDVWKQQLRKDCERQDKLRAFEGMGEYGLKMFWEFGVDPTLQAILTYSPEAKPKPN